MLQVTKPFNTVDEIQDTIHYRHGHVLQRGDFEKFAAGGGGGDKRMDLTSYLVVLTSE